MAKYNMQPNEVVVLTESNVSHGGFLSAYTDELILTNLNLVLAKKGILGNNKGVLTFPIDQIKVWNGRAQAMAGKASNGSAVLEVFFLNGREKFSFQAGGKRKIAKWSSQIDAVVSGKATPAAPEAGMALPGTEAVADALVETFKVFKGKVTGSRAPVQISGKCRSCGASVAGIKNQSLTCDYCGTAQQI